MMEADIEIETSDRSLLMDLFEAKDFVLTGKTRKISEEVYLRYEYTKVQETLYAPDVINLTLMLAEDVVLPIALNIVSNWLYDKIKNRGVVKRINDVEVQMDKDEIKEVLMKRIREKAPRKEYSVSFSFPEISRDELMKAARTLGRRPITYNEGELPFPDNEVFYADYNDDSNKIDAIVYIRDKAINDLYEKGMPLYAMAQIYFRQYSRLFFTGLILSLKAIPSSFKMKQVKKCS